MEVKKTVKVEKKPKKRVFNQDVVPFKSKTYATIHRTLRGTRK